MRSFLDHCGPTQHLIGNVVVDHTPTTATSTCYVQDLHVGRGELADQTFSARGEYRDKWVVTNLRAGHACGAFPIVVKTASIPLAPSSHHRDSAKIMSNALVAP